MSRFPIAFGRHLLLERINVGGMAEVFKAKAFGVEGFERVVAVKRILPTLAQDEEFVTMFIDEARIAAHLNHQNIVQIYELGKHEEIFYISMEYVAGRDLRQLLDHQKKLDRPMELPKACFLISRVCEALEYAHRRRDPAGRDMKIIHRDVTPQNVIISYEGEVKLCDFGIAKAASRVSRTQVGVLKGKFAYMSPEQVRGHITDRRSDLFALGVIFYEMLTGQRLFLGDSDYQTLEAVRNAVIPPPRSYNPQISPDLEQILLRMLARDPKDRYQWAAEIHEDLLDHLVQDGRPYHARHLRVWMQDAYARDIEVEHAKLEEFMRLRLPEASGAPARPDPLINRAPDDGVFEEEPGDATDHMHVPGPELLRSLRREDETERGAAPEEPAVPTTVASPSPVSNLFGAPELVEDGGAGDLMVVAAGGSDRRGLQTIEEEDEALSDAERTQFDLDVGGQLGFDTNETLFEDDGETALGQEGRLADQIVAAQAEILERLNAAGALEPAPGRPRRVGEPSRNEALDDTMRAPLLLGDEDLDAAFAPTSMRADSADMVFPEEEGTAESAPDAFVLGAARPLEGETSDLEAEAPAPPRPRAPPLGSASVNGAAAGRPALRAGWSRPRAVEERTSSHAAREPLRREPSAPSEEPPAAPARTGRGRERLWAAAGVGGLALAALVTFTVYSLSPSEASLSVLTEPVRAVEILLDGELVGRSTPLEIQPLALGTHRIELRAPGFRPYTQTIQIAEPKPHTMMVPLERLAPVPEPEEPEEDAAPGPTEPRAPAPAPSAASPPTPERRSPEGEPKKIAAAPAPVERPRVESEPKRAPAPSAPAPSAPAPVERPRVESEPKRAPAPSARAPEGSLIVSTRPPGVWVLIDGKETGLKTPIRKPVALPAGKHVITFVMGNGRRYDFDVSISAGEITKLDKPLR